MTEKYYRNIAPFVVTPCGEWVTIEQGRYSDVAEVNYYLTNNVYLLGVEFLDKYSGKEAQELLDNAFKELKREITINYLRNLCEKLSIEEYYYSNPLGTIK